MSLESGIAVLNLEYTEKVPRTEYSVENHWPLLKVVTGIDTDIKDNRIAAQKEFIKKWDYAFYWRTYVDRKYFYKGRITKIGHALFSEDVDGNKDYDSNKTQAFNNIEDIFTLDFFEEYGEFDQKTLIENFHSDYKEINKKFPGTLNMGGVYITLISGFIEILGWEMLLLALGTSISRFQKAIDRYYHWVKQFYDAYIKTDIPVIMCHDDLCWTSGPIVAPSWYREFIFPYYKKLITPLKEAGKKIIFTSDGNYTEFLDDLVRCDIDMFCMEPGVDMKYFAGKYGKTHGFVGNFDTRILLTGSRDDIYKEVKRCMDIGKKFPGFVMAVGNHIPINTPVDSILYYNDIYHKLSER